MPIYKTKKEFRKRRHNRLRQKMSGTSECPRLSICSTSRHIYVQFIDDEHGRTLIAVSTLDPEFRKQSSKSNMEAAKLLGKIAADRAQSSKIKTVVFDRGGFIYHGRIKAFADAAREGGLQF